MLVCSAADVQQTLLKLQQEVPALKGMRQAEVLEKGCFSVSPAARSSSLQEARLLLAASAAAAPAAAAAAGRRQHFLLAEEVDASSL